MKPKEMIYRPKRKIELLYNQIYKGYHYYILSLGVHPTAYIEIPRSNILFNKNWKQLYDMGVYLPVNGGITYSSDKLWTGDNTIMQNSWFIGWDYAHCDDYLGYDELYPLEIRTGGKKWTIKEIIKECENGIDYINSLLDTCKGEKI